MLSNNTISRRKIQKHTSTRMPMNVHCPTSVVQSHANAHVTEQASKLLRGEVVRAPRDQRTRVTKTKCVEFQAKSIVR
jgi:hypothetical protein